MDSTDPPQADGIEATGDSMPRGNSITWRLAQLLIVASAFALLWVFTEMGAVCCGIPIAIAGYLIVSIVGKFVQGPALRRKVSMTLVVCMSLAVVGSAWYRTVPDRLFREYVANPMPSSVRVLHSQYQEERDPAIFLYFEFSPNDLDAILRTREYRKHEIVIVEEMRIRSRKPPSWWNPGSLTNPSLHEWPSQVEYQPYSVWLWVDESKTKAYCAILYQ